MKKLNYTKLGPTTLLALLLVGCTLDYPESPVLAPPAGEQTFEKYMALGNSLTAGYMDSGLIMNGQMNSYPLLIAQQMGYDVTPGTTADFTQPWVAFPGIGRTEAPTDSVAGVLYWNGTGIDVSEFFAESEVQTKLPALSVPLAYNNLGVPLAATVDVLNAINAASSITGENSYFDLFLRNPAFGQNTTMLQQGIGGNPTLVTLYVGSNDILWGATSGNPQVGLDPEAGDNITPPDAFASMFQSIIDTLTVKVEERTGFPPFIVVGNIVSISDIPFFIPKAGFDFVYPGWTYEEADVSLVLFPVLQWIANPANQGNPIPGTLTLTTAEVITIETASNDYNTRITGICDPLEIPVVDLKTVMDNLPAEQKSHFVFLLQAGNTVPEAAATTVFSLDGVHPNNRGYGVVANAFISAINTAQGTSLSTIPISSLTWDPTYGIPPGKRDPDTPEGLLTPAGARAMRGMFR